MGCFSHSKRCVRAGVATRRSVATRYVIAHDRCARLLFSLKPRVHSTSFECPVYWQAANRSVWKWHRQGGRDFPSFLSFPIADGLTLARKWSSSSGTINANRSSRAVEVASWKITRQLERGREREGCSTLAVVSQPPAHKNTLSLGHTHIHTVNSKPLSVTKCSKAAFTMKCTQRNFMRNEQCIYVNCVQILKKKSKIM